MGKFKVYISCPMSVPQSKIDDFAKVILKLGADVDFWQRGTPYNNLALKRADAIVVLLEMNKWKMPYNDLSRGTKSEIDYAFDNDIPIYLGYHNGNKENAIYETIGVGKGSLFEGMRGTSHDLANEIEEFNDMNKAKPAPAPKDAVDAIIKAQYQINALKIANAGMYGSFTNIPQRPSVINMLKGSQGNNDIVSAHKNIGTTYLSGIFSSRFGIIDVSSAPMLLNTPGNITALEWLRGKRPVIYGTPGNCATGTGKTTTSTYDKRLLIILR